MEERQAGGLFKAETRDVGRGGHQDAQGQMDTCARQTSDIKVGVDTEMAADSGRIQQLPREVEDVGQVGDNQDVVVGGQLVLHGGPHPSQPPVEHLRAVLHQILVGDVLVPCEAINVAPAEVAHSLRLCARQGLV